MYWLDDFLATSQSKTNLPVKGQFKEDEDTQSLHDKENLVMIPDITSTSELIKEEEEDTEPGFSA